MPKKWTCKEKCYVPVGSVCKLRHPGDPAEGEIEEIYQKYFDLVQDIRKPEASFDEYSAVKARLIELKIKFHPATGLSKLKKLLAKAEKEQKE